MSDANMVPGKRSKGAGCLRLLGRVVIGGVILLLGLAIIGAIYQGIASARDEKLYKPVDQMVDVNGIQLRLDCRGSGSPTVVLEAGAQSSSIVWVRVQDDVAKFTRVCSYDRAGYGWSDPVLDSLYPEQVADMLHNLLEKAGEGPPYLLVGHSLGGIFVRTFAEKYPDEVVGMVLVDSTHENQDEQIPPVLAELTDPKLFKTTLQIQQIIASTGLLRAFKLLDASNPIILLTEDEKGSALAEMYRPVYFGAYAREMDMMFAYTSIPRKLNSLGDMPLIVVSVENNAQEMYAGYENIPQVKSKLSVEMMQQYADFLNGLQEELAALSTRSRHIVVKDSGHFIQLEKPQVVIDAIQEVFEQIPR